jgi:hypothetical protein
MADQWEALEELAGEKRLTEANAGKLLLRCTSAQSANRCTSRLRASI